MGPFDGSVKSCHSEVDGTSFTLPAPLFDFLEVIVGVFERRLKKNLDKFGE